MIIRTSKPSDMTLDEREEFIRFVETAGEVSATTLSTLVSQSLALVTIHHGKKLVATAAIKNPSDKYRIGVFRKARAKGDANLYPFELGWVVVHPDHRRQGHARTIVSEAIKAASGKGVYATTKSDQMKKILTEKRFLTQGKPYPSTLEPDSELTLLALPDVGTEIRAMRLPSLQKRMKSGSMAGATTVWIASGLYLAVIQARFSIFSLKSLIYFSIGSVLAHFIFGNVGYALDQILLKLAYRSAQHPSPIQGRIIRTYSLLNFAVIATVIFLTASWLINL